MEKEIINIAIENLNHQPKTQADWIDEGKLDDTVKVLINRKAYFYHIEVKKELRRNQPEAKEIPKQRKKYTMTTSNQSYKELALSAPFYTF